VERAALDAVQHFQEISQYHIQSRHAPNSRPVLSAVCTYGSDTTGTGTTQTP
jgi:hypothetical protein